MYAVIFKAEINKFDKSYAKMAMTLQQLAKEKYGCLEFISTTEEKQEIAISYWESLDQINLWKQDAQHRSAQKLGMEKWYKSYHVQVVEVIREYSNGTSQR